jgi:type IV secretion system protein TrbE
MLALGPFKNKASGFNDQLDWGALIDDGIVQNKSGLLLAGYWFRGPDVASSTNAERNALCVRVNAALTRLGSGWCYWIDASRIDAVGYPAPEVSHFPDPISRMIDDERREQFESEGRHFESEYAVVFCSMPPLRRNSRLLDLIYDEDPARRKNPAWRILEQFKKDLAGIEDTLSGAVHLRRMKGFIITDPDGSEHLSDELVNYLNFTLTEDILALKIPSAGAYLDTLLGLQNCWNEDPLQYGEHYIACVGISGFPEESFPQILASLDQLEICYRWSIRFIPLDQHEAVEDLKKYRRKWKQKIRGFVSQMFNTQGGVIDEDAQLMTRQAETAIGLAQSGLVTYGYHTAVVVLRDADPDRLIDNARLVRREIQRCGFAARIEDFNTLEAWLGSLPGHPIPNVRRPLEHTDNLSNLMPLSSVWSGSPVHPNPLYPPNSPPLFYAATTGATPFRCSLHSGDIGHVLLLGPIGSGKSTGLCFFAASELRYPGATIGVLDKGRSMKTLCQAVGGLHYEIAGEGTPSFCPLGDLDTDLDRAEAADWVATCFALQYQKAPQPHHTEAIHRALVLLSESQDRSITHFIATVQNQEVRDAMHDYSLAGTMGHLYDAESDGLADHHFVVHEIGDLLALKPVASIPAILHIFRKFKRQLKGQPALLIIDEAWVAFGNPLISERLREALKEFRKLCCGVIMATQSLSDAVASGLFPVLVESCAYKICLPNPDAAVEGTERHPGPKDYYLALGYNEAQIDIIRYATPKRHLYVSCPEGDRLIDLGLGPTALAFCGVSDPKDLARIETLQRLHGEQWPYAWLQAKENGRELVLAAE